MSMPSIRCRECPWPLAGGAVELAGVRDRCNSKNCPNHNRVREVRARQRRAIKSGVGQRAPERLALVSVESQKAGVGQRRARKVGAGQRRAGKSALVSVAPETRPLRSVSSTQGQRRSIRR